MKSINASPLMRLQNYKEPLVKRLNENYKPKVDDITDRAESAAEKSTALGKLTGFVKNYTQAALALQNPVISPFDKKMATVTTTDTGLPAKYVSVVTNQKAVSGSYDVRVEQVAKASKMTFFMQTENNNGIGNKNNIPQADGVLTINTQNDTGGNVANIVPVVATDTFDVIIRKINDKFSDNGIKASAVIIRGSDAPSIKISYQNEGPKNLSVVWTAATALVEDACNLAEITDVGQSAIITIDGLEIQQDSNVFDKAIDGVTITALVPNTAGDLNKQTVKVVPDSSNSGVLLNVVNFSEAYNNLKVFVAKMTEKSSAKEYADTAILHDTSEIRQANALLDSIFVDYAVVGGGKYKSLADIGIGLISAPKADQAPAGTMVLGTVDATKLEDAVTNNYEDFTALFRGTLKINTHSVGGSTLHLSYVKGLVDNSLINKPMNITLKPAATRGELLPAPKVGWNEAPILDAGLNQVLVVGGVRVDIPGVTDVEGSSGPIYGKYERHNEDAYGYINFEGTPLEGLQLQWDGEALPNDAGDEVFNAQLTQGIADFSYFKSSDLINETGSKGSLLLSSELMQDKAKKLSTEQTKLEDTLKEKLAELDKQFQEIERISVINDMFLDTMSSLINPSN